MSTASRNRHARVAIAELRKVRGHVTALGLYHLVPDLRCKSGFASVRAFGTGAVLESRDGKTRYHVAQSGEFRDVDKKPKMTKHDKRRQRRNAN